MSSLNLVFVVVISAAIMATVRAGMLEHLFPKIMKEKYNYGPHKSVYRFKIGDPQGSNREEIGVVMNPGTPLEELVIIGSNTFYDPNTNTELNTVFTADKTGYRSRYIFEKHVNVDELKNMPHTPALQALPDKPHSPYALQQLTN